MFKTDEVWPNLIKFVHERPNFTEIGKNNLNHTHDPKTAKKVPEFTNSTKIERSVQKQLFLTKND